MSDLKALLFSLYETICWFLKNRVVWHSYFERTIVRGFKLVRQEATIDVTSGSISWVDAKKENDDE